jgi:hypothetical protein
MKASGSSKIAAPPVADRMLPFRRVVCTNSHISVDGTLRFYIYVELDPLAAAAETIQ